MKRGKPFNECANCRKPMPAGIVAWKLRRGEPVLCLDCAELRRGARNWVPK